MSDSNPKQLGSEAGSKTAGGLTVYIMEELGDARLRCEQLKRYIAEASKMVNNSTHRDHFFEVAGNLIYGIPHTLFKLDKALDAVAMAAARLDYEELKQQLKPEKADELEQVMKDVRLRSPQRRSEPQPFQPKQATMFKAAAQSHIAGALDRLATFTETFPHPAEVSARVRRVLMALSQTSEQALQAMGPMQAGSREDVIKGFKSANPDLTDEQLEKFGDEWERNKDVVKDQAKAASSGPKFKAASAQHVAGALRRIRDGVHEGTLSPKEASLRLHRVLMALSQTAQQSMEAMGPMQANSREEVIKGFKGANPALSEEQLNEIADQWEKNKDVVKDKQAVNVAARFAGERNLPFEQAAGRAAAAVDDKELKTALTRLAVAKKAVSAVSESEAEKLVASVRKVYKEAHDLFDEAHRTKADYYAPIDPKLVEQLKDLHGEVLRGLNALSRIDSKGVDPLLIKDLSTFGHMGLSPDTISEAAGLGYVINNKALLVLMKARRAAQQVRFYTNWIESYKSTGSSPSMDDQWKWLRSGVSL